MNLGCEAIPLFDDIDDDTLLRYRNGIRFLFLLFSVYFYTAPTTKPIPRRFLFPLAVQWPSEIAAAPKWEIRRNKSVRISKLNDINNSFLYYATQPGRIQFMCHPAKSSATFAGIYHGMKIYRHFVDRVLRLAVSVWFYSSLSELT